MKSVINVADQVRHTSCAVGGNVVTVTLICATVPAARDLFNAFRRALEVGGVSLQTQAVEPSP